MNRNLLILKRKALVVKVAAPWFGLALLAACHAQTVNVHVTVYPDGSGKVTTFTLHPIAALSGAEAEKDGFLKGAKEYSIKRATADLREAVFADVNKLDMGGIRFAFREADKGHEIVVTMPVGGDAPWYKAIGLTPDEVKSFDEARKNGLLTDLPEDFDLKIMVSIVMPGMIQDQKMDPSLPKGWTQEVDTPTDHAFSFERDRKIRANLIIPVREVLNATSSEVKWTIRSAKMAPFVKRDWDKFREKHPGLK